MSRQPVVYDLAELSDLAGVTPRTVRYYIQQGLLRSPGVSGPGAKYDRGHLDRLRLIRRLQRDHLPLAEIRRRLESVSDAEVASLVTQSISPAVAPGPRRTTAAASYARQLLDAGSTVPSVPGPPPAPSAAGRSQWERIALTPDLELHVRRPLSREDNKVVERLLAYARGLLEENAP